MIRVESTERFEPAFFAAFTEVANRITAADPACRFRLPERLEENEALFGAGSTFSRNNRWRAFLARDERGAAIGRLVASRSPAHEAVTFVPVGFFECQDAPEAAAALFAAGEQFAREQGVGEIRGPMNGNFFNSYRLRIPNATRPFSGEPVHPAYYLSLFEKSGFQRSHHWVTLRLHAWQAFANYRAIADRFFGRRAPRTPGLRERRLDRRRWTEELRRLYDMLQTTWASLPNYTPVCWEEFVERYDGFKRVIDERMVRFVEKDGVPIAFLISYMDPLPIQLWHARSRLPSPARDLVALLWSKVPVGREMLIPYIGKVPAADGVRGVSGLLGRELVKQAVLRCKERALICYVVDGSPSLQILPKGLEVVSEYVLYSKAVGPAGAA